MIVDVENLSQRAADITERRTIVRQLLLLQAHNILLEL
jgi:hypothetical protein